MRFLRLTGTAILLFVLLLLAAVQLFGDPIARRVVQSLNHRLQTDITVQRYDLSLLRAFPNLSVDLQNVSVTGSDGGPLLEAEHLACLLDLGSLFGKIRVHGILVENGSLQLFTDRDGNTNYQATYTSVGDRQEGGDAGAATVEFAAEQARLSNISLIYQDERLATDARLEIEEATFSGDFGARQYLLTTQAEAEIVYFDQEGQRYVDRQSVVLSGTTAIDQESRQFTFSPLHLRAAALELEASGQLTPTEEGLTFALSVSSQSGNLEDVFRLLPPTYAGTLTEVETSGSLTMRVEIDGAWTDTDYPRINGRLSFTDGRLESPRMNVGARDLDLQATFAYLDGPRGGVQTFAIERLAGKFGGEPFAMQLRMENLNDPEIDFSAEGSLPLATLPALLGDGPITDGDGRLLLEGVSLSGRYADMVVPRRMGRVASAGQIRVEDGQVTFNERELHFPTGSLRLDDNRLTVEQLSFAMEETELQFSGEATNLIPVLFADSLNTQDAALEFTARLSGPLLDISELLALSEPTEQELEDAEASGTTDSLTRRGIERRARVTDLLDGRFEAEVEQWRWDELHGEDFRGQLIFRPGQLDLRGLTAAMDGQFRIDATTYFQYTTRAEARLTATGVDATEFFAQSENFGQEVLTADNLSGRMNARLLIDLYYDTLGAVDYDELRVRAGLEILDGELRDFGMLENFAFALKSKDLERVRFMRLANFLEIRDRTIYIPAMFIQSSAINLTLSGSHTFDQYLDYFIKVNAGQVIANKLSRHDDGLEVLPARNGLFNLYYTVHGPLENYVVESNKGAVKDDFRRSGYRRERVRQELEQRFQTPIELLDPAGEEDAGR